MNEDGDARRRTAGHVSFGAYAVVLAVPIGLGTVPVPGDKKKDRS